MLEAFISGFWQTVAWPAFGYMLIGIAIGFFVGLLPGIGGLSTLALMLPFSYSIKEPISAFAFLLGMLAVTGTTGDLTSILFGIPGEGSSAALILDGYPDVEKRRGRPRPGRGDHELGARRRHRRSLAGTVDPDHAPAGAAVRLAGIVYHRDHGHHLHRHLGRPIVDQRPARRRYRPHARRHRRRSANRFAALHLRLALFVGPARLIPVVVGMFAIPEIVDLAVRGTSIASGKTEKLHGVMEGVKDSFRHFWLVVRCSLIGVYFGVLPVLGANVAQWISYAHAVQGLKDKSRAGKGAVEGLLGPGARK